MQSAQADDEQGRAPARAASIVSGVDRILLASQLLFSVVVLGIVVFVLLSPAEPSSVALFIAGAALVIAAGVATIVVPWTRLPTRWVTVVPLIDVFAVALIYVGMPEVSTAVLWIFPIMWLAAYLAPWSLWIGLSIAIGTILAEGIYRPLALGPGVIPEWLIVPLLLVVVAIAAASNARRRRDQRRLQMKQAEMLAKALARARTQEVVMSEILDAVSFGIVRISASGEITLMNLSQEQFERIRGEDDDIYDADGTTRLTAENGPHASALRGETFTDRIIWYGRAERRRVALAVSAIQLQSTSSVAGDVLMVYRDVTEQLNAVRARDDLLSSVSHELRTPLTSMMGYLDLVLEDANLPAATRSKLDIVERNGDRLLELITQILEASRGDSEVTLEPEWADLADVVMQSIEMHELPASDRGIRFDIEAMRHVKVRFDVSRIRQVVDNMLSNAIKYNREFGLVSITIDEFKNEVALRVSDTGFGVTPEELNRVFDRHFRSERVRNSSIHGNGLGLSISRDIARQHGGELEMVSTSGEGSTIMLVLPKAGPADGRAAGV